jgi:hypothetical protein
MAPRSSKKQFLAPPLEQSSEKCVLMVVKWFPTIRPKKCYKTRSSAHVTTKLAPKLITIP